ncbi:MAG: pirin family protein, partial [Panacibacter sp.]
SLGKMDKDFITSYDIKNNGNGVYAFVLEGEVTINNQKLGKRDALGTWDTDKLNITANTNAEILLIEVPMNLN